MSHTHELAYPAPIHTTHNRFHSAGGATAWTDWLYGTRRFDIWATLAWYDVLLRYRRSLLGPLWLTLSMGALILGMGPLYATLLNAPLTIFFPHLTLGIIFWSFMSGAIQEGCQTYILAATYLKQAPYSRSIFAWRVVARHAIYLIHHLVLFLPVAAWAGIAPRPSNVLVIPALVIVLANLHALALSLGFLSARFRDIPQIVGSIMQLLMFVTPVFWLPDGLPERARIVLLNPLAAFLTLLRAPLLGELPSGRDWLVAALFTALNFTIAATLYVRCRRRVVYWV